MRSEREKMLAGEHYRCDDPELVIGKNDSTYYSISLSSWRHRSQTCNIKLEPFVLRARL